MKPFYQGKVDVFCALYAVLNGLKITHHIRTLEARDIFHDTLMGLAQNNQIFRAVLDQRTDYVAMVDAMLNIQAKKRPLHIERPYENNAELHTPSVEHVWNTLEMWLAPNAAPSASKLPRIPERVAIFRFLRYLMPGSDPVNRHWTTAYKMENGQLHFFDCSMEETAIYSITPESFVTRPQEISAEKLICFEPHSLRLLSPLGKIKKI